MSDSFFGIVHLPTYLIGTRTVLTGGAGAAFVGFGVKLATAATN
jgi:hypothetical protein